MLCLYYNIDKGFKNTLVFLRMILSTTTFLMAKKGREKNTVNKAKHSKLMAQKINKKKKEEVLRKNRLKAILKKS